MSFLQRAREYYPHQAEIRSRIRDSGREGSRNFLTLSIICGANSTRRERSAKENASNPAVNSLESRLFAGARHERISSAWGVFEGFGKYYDDSAARGDRNPPCVRA